LWVFALVIDSDSDKGRAWTPTAQASIIVETSPGNAHFWFCLARAVDAAEGKTIGERMRKSAGADQDTGVITQCYRVAGTPNFPSESKRKRGRVSIEPTKILEQSETSLEEALERSQIPTTAMPLILILTPTPALTATRRSSRPICCI